MIPPSGAALSPRLTSAQSASYRGSYWPCPRHFTETTARPFLPHLDQGEDTNVVDLMAALRASLAAKDKGAARKPKPAAKKPTKPRARKAS
jgi:hypothetical protein